MKLLGLILVVVGVILLGAAAAQHFLGLSAISHLAIYLGVFGLVAVLPGAWLSLRRSGRGTTATTAPPAAVVVEGSILVVPGPLSEEGEEAAPSAVVEAPQETPAPQGAAGPAEGGPETPGGQPDTQQPA